MPPRHLPLLNHLRGAATLVVFLYHCLGVAYGRSHLPWDGWLRDFSVDRSLLLLWPVTYGWAGVAVFFVVSGFCIQLSFARGAESQPSQGWFSFFVRRLLRIVPPYLLALCLFSFVWPWGTFSLESPYQFRQFFSHLWLLHNFDVQTFWGINPAFWSIAIEAQLYLLFPLLLLLVRWLGWGRSLLLVGMLEFTLRGIGTLQDLNGMVVPDHGPMALPLAYWWSWALGAYLADCYRSGRRSFLAAMRLDLVAVVAVGCPLWKPTVGLAFPAFALLTAVLIDRQLVQQSKLAEETPAWWNRFTEPLNLLGQVSYSFYLLHLPLLEQVRIGVVSASGLSLPPLAKFAFYVAMYPALLLLSRLFFVGVEQPAMRWGRFLASQLGSLRKGQAREVACEAPNP